VCISRESYIKPVHLIRKIPTIQVIFDGQPPSLRGTKCLQQNRVAGRLRVSRSARAWNEMNQETEGFAKT
jgi:hypothetical protein